MSAQTQQNPTVVLVHAAWSDASSWNKVITRLHLLSLPVVSAQIPLTSLSDDILAVRRVLNRMTGPVILVAHSYGGAVITGAAHNRPEVKALAFVAAIVPDENETVGDLFHRAEAHPKAPALVPDESGLLWMSADGFANAVAHEAASEDLLLMTATQKPISVKCLGEAMTRPAWKEMASWYLLAENDRMISPHTQRFMAERMNAHIHPLPVDHSPLASAPDSVVKLIVAAIDGTRKSALPTDSKEGESIQIVKEFYEALRAGDVNRALAVLSPDLEWTEAEGFPYYSGTWNSPRAVAEKLLIPLSKDWSTFSVTPHEFLAQDERVVSFGTYTGIYRDTNRSMSAPFAHRWVVHGSKIVRFNMYTDTVKVLAAMRAPEP